MYYQVVAQINESFVLCLINVQQKVNELISQGWKPQGSISVLRFCDSDSIYKIAMMQAMIRE